MDKHVPALLFFLLVLGVLTTALKSLVYFLFCAFALSVLVGFIALMVSIVRSVD